MGKATDKVIDPGVGFGSGKGVQTDQGMVVEKEPDEAEIGLEKGNVGNFGNQLLENGTDFG